MDNKPRVPPHATKNILLEAIIQSMQDKKATAITLLDLQNMHQAIASYFILCTAQAKTHVQAIAENIMEKSYAQTGQRPWHKEGFDNKEWILLDYADVVVHVFQPETRAYYDLESLWGDAAIIKICN